MILCTLGTHPQPFERAVDWILEAIDETDELVIQHGTTPPRDTTPGVRWLPYIRYDEMVELIGAAEAVVCHGGVGTLMTAIDLGRVPVAIPRLSSLDEHVDDHQLQIVVELGRSGYVVACRDREDLRPALAAAVAKGGRPWPVAGDLRRAAILAAGGEP